jgi:hypothetical protein
MTEARTGNPYTIAVRKNALPIPKRFYCHWKLPGDQVQYDSKGKELKDDPLNRCCFNHRVGLPTRKWETDTSVVEVIPVELTHFNHRMMRNYFRHRKYSQNKCRGSGASEILTIRYMVFKYGVMTNVQNRKCIILPGTSSKLSTEFSTRIKALCDKIPQIYNKIPTSDKPVEFSFKTGGRLVLTSATPDAERGFENVGDLDHEEVAHWDMVDDMPVYYASEGVFEKTKCHLYHNTTPRGKRGFYYDLVWSPDASSDFYKHVTNWREVVGLPVEKVEDLYDLGHIDDKKLAELRKELVHKFHHDAHYRNWYETFEKSGVKVFWDNGELIPIEEIIDIPIPILDINAIIADSQTDRSHYDQELDNEFISGENRAIGAFQEEDLRPDDLRAQIAKYTKSDFTKQEFNPEDFE